MGTEVLRPHDCLNQRLGVVSPEIFPRRKSFYGNPRINRKQAVRPIPDRSKPSFSKRSSSNDLKYTKNNTTTTTTNNNLVVGQVTILRRGELLDSKIESAKKHVPIVFGTERLGPETPEMVPKQIQINDLKSFLFPLPATARSDMYAGSAFSMSPSPNSLPVPSFSKKKQVSPIVVDSATRDLRRLLRLD